MEASTTTGAAPQFTITRQDHTQSYDQQGNPTSYWQVYFKTALGVESFVRVDDSDYNPAHVATIVGERARTIDEVQSLGGDASQAAG